MSTVSSLLLADHDEWVPLWRDYVTFYESELSDDATAVAFSRLVERDGMYAALARDADDRAVGFVHWTTHRSTWNPADYCYLEDLFVAPQARGGGVGQMLIKHVLEWADDAGCGKVYWLTQETNAVARAMYDVVARSTGFVHYEIPIRGE